MAYYKGGEGKLIPQECEINSIFANGKKKSNEANLRDREFAWLIFGVHNKTREITGTSYKNSQTSLQKLKHDIAQHTTDRNTFRDIFELTVEGKRVLMFQIPAAPRGIPMGWLGHFYARKGESLTALDMSKYEEIRHQTVEEDWSAVTLDDATLKDLSQVPSRRLWP